jgi:hypothetical protein
MSTRGCQNPVGRVMVAKTSRRSSSPGWLVWDAAGALWQLRVGGGGGGKPEKRWTAIPGGAWVIRKPAGDNPAPSSLMLP